MRQINCIFVASFATFMVRYIYQNPNWTRFTWDEKHLNSLFGEVRHLQGKISGKMSTLGIGPRTETTLQTLTLDLVKSSEIEGEFLNMQKVRSSLAKRLGVNIAGILPSDRSTDGMVEMLLDATQRFSEKLTNRRLFSWHAALFPSGHSGIVKIEVGKYRSGEMQIVSGTMGKEVVHFEAIPSKKVIAEMKFFLDWVNKDDTIDPVIKAAIAHFWFIIIHPFDDGNGRIARTLTDYLLARSENSPDRFYSMSSQIMKERKKYYEVLNKVQYSDGDITEWLEWFFKCLRSALQETENTLHRVMDKVKFWDKYENEDFNYRQRLMINKLWDGFEGKLRTSKWAKICKCSSDTALRDIKDLIERGVLNQEEPGGRSTNYELCKIP